MHAASSRFEDLLKCCPIAPFASKGPPTACAAPPIAPSVAGRLHQLVCLFKHWSLRTKLLSDCALGVKESYARLAVRGAVGVGAGAFAVEDVGCAL